MDRGAPDGVGTLDLVVALRVGWLCVADLGAHLLAKLDEGRTCELRAIIGDDAVGDTEPHEDAADELHGCCCGNLPDRLRFRLFGELIDGHE